MRWLVEVFFEDWTLYEGWGREAKQWDEEGSSRGLILSLLFDHCLLLHPEQTARMENKLPAYTVGSRQRKSQMEVLLDKSKPWLEHQNPAGQLKELAGLVDDVFQLMPSGKHYGWQRFRPDGTGGFATVPSGWMIFQESKCTKFKNLNIEFKSFIKWFVRNVTTKASNGYRIGAAPS